MNITGMNEQWVTARIKQKGDSKCIPWKNLKDIILAHPDTKKKVDVFGIWGAVGYAPLLVLRQYRSRQFVPATQGLAECEFLYKGDGYKKKVREMTNAWNETSRMKSLAMGPMATHEYNKWWVKRINDNVPRPSSKNSQAIEEHLRVVPSELEIIKQDFERRNKLEVKKLRKGKNKAEEDLDNLKTDYKKLRLSIRTDRLGKNSEQ
ncbi:hypothetical protein Goklo_024497 [Gossypium klotzschianum]|uniref:Aminotransferase-like plant mobile domain-containing protein n=1 Tax=Gossypium klotzschianum TaxID=34286 RepID=A0A7J8W8T9_9ROSI|nr:hypothetical protein [Gossypium klotzschianum]